MCSPAGTITLAHHRRELAGGEQRERRARASFAFLVLQSGLSVRVCDGTELERPRIVLLTLTRLSSSAGTTAVRVCVFDLDGVLRQTAISHTAAWKEAADAYLLRACGRASEALAGDSSFRKRARSGLAAVIARLDVFCSQRAKQGAVGAGDDHAGQVLLLHSCSDGL